jgi:hypothetical protein
VAQDNNVECGAWHKLRINLDSLFVFTVRLCPKGAVCVVPLTSQTLLTQPHFADVDADRRLATAAAGASSRGVPRRTANMAAAEIQSVIYIEKFLENNKIKNSK